MLYTLCLHYVQVRTYVTMSSILSSIQQYLPTAAIILLPNVLGATNALITRDGIRVWYRKLKQPALTPPDWIFGPVWNTIYLCMGVSSYLIFREGGFEAQMLPLSLFGAQLFINWVWSPIFFVFHRIDLVGG